MPKIRQIESSVLSASSGLEAVLGRIVCSHFPRCRTSTCSMRPVPPLVRVKAAKNHKPRSVFSGKSDKAGVIGETDFRANLLSSGLLSRYQDQIDMASEQLTAQPSHLTAAYPPQRPVRWNA